MVAHVNVRRLDGVKTVDAVMSGGSTKFPAHIGFLQALEDLGFNVETNVSCSAGALVGLLYACGVSTDELWDITVNQDFTKYVNTNIFNIIRLLMFGHMSNGKKFHGFLSEITEGKLLGEMPKNGYAVASEFTEIDKKIHNSFHEANQRGRMVLVGPRTFPEMEVATAIQMSAAMPFAFKPIRYKHKLYYDGGLYRDFPLQNPYTENPVIGHIIYADNPGMFKSWGILRPIRFIRYSFIDANIDASIETAGIDKIIVQSHGADVQMFDFKVPIDIKEQLREEAYNNTIRTIKPLMSAV